MKDPTSGKAIIILAEVLIEATSEGWMADSPRLFHRSLPTYEAAFRFFNVPDGLSVDKFWIAVAAKIVESNKRREAP